MEYDFFTPLLLLGIVLGGGIELVKENGAEGAAWGWTAYASRAGNGAVDSTSGGDTAGCVPPPAIDESAVCDAFQGDDDTEYDFFSCGFSISGSRAAELNGGAALAVGAPLLVPIASRYEPPVFGTDWPGLHLEGL